MSFFFLTVISFSLLLSAWFLKRQILRPAQNLSKVNVPSAVATFLREIFCLFKSLLIKFYYFKLSMTPFGTEPLPPCSSLSFLHQCSISAIDTRPDLLSSRTSNNVLIAFTNLGGKPSRALDC